MSGGREFPVYAQGQLRELYLTVLRDGLRTRVNPDTGAVWTEEEIQLATSAGTSEFARATATDLVLLAIQGKAPWLADQVVASRASMLWLRTLHAPQVGAGEPLPASGGGGLINAPTTGSATFLGSTTIPDPVAHLLLDSGGRRYQVLYDATTSGATTARLFVKAIDGGPETNLAPGAILRWYRSPTGVELEATVAERFRGGRPAETTAEYGERVLEAKRYRRGAGASSQWASWVRKIDSSIQQAFVYACAFNAGSLAISLTQRRSAGDRSPLARIPDASLISIVTARIVPPGAPDVPASPFVLVVPPQSAEVTMSARLKMPRGRGRGWLDTSPWPRVDPGGIATILTVASQTDITITGTGGDDPEPGQIPRVMVWSEDDMSFVPLEVSSWVRVGSDYQLILTNPPSLTLVAGMVVSPEAGCRTEIANGAMAYFDSLGPGDIVIDTDLRSGRSARWPAPDTRWPTTPDSTMVSTSATRPWGSCSTAPRSRSARS
jgi:Baseplate J-like protein